MNIGNVTPEVLANNVFTRLPNPFKDCAFVCKHWAQIIRSSDFNNLLLSVVADRIEPEEAVKLWEKREIAFASGVSPYEFVKTILLGQKKEIAKFEDSTFRLRELPLIDLPFMELPFIDKVVIGNHFIKEVQAHGFLRLYQTYLNDAFSNIDEVDDTCALAKKEILEIVNADYEIKDFYDFCQSRKFRDLKQRVILLLNDLKEVLAERKDSAAITLSLPDDMYSLPPEIANFTSCSGIFMNILQGSTLSKLRSIPIEIARLEQLKEFIALGPLSLTIFPEELCAVPNLTSLGLNNCNKMSVISNKIGELKELEGLTITSSLLSELPESMRQLRNLKEITLNEFSRPRPFRSITYMNLSVQQVVLVRTSGVMNRLHDIIYRLENPSKWDGKMYDWHVTSCLNCIDEMFPGFHKSVKKNMQLDPKLKEKKWEKDDWINHPKILFSAIQQELKTRFDKIYPEGSEERQAFYQKLKVFTATHYLFKDLGLFEYAFKEFRSQN